MLLGLLHTKGFSLKYGALHTPGLLLYQSIPCINLSISKTFPCQTFGLCLKPPQVVPAFLAKKEVCPTYASPVADAPGGRDGALSEVAGLDVGGLCARTVDHVLVAILIVVLPGVDLTAGHQALPVSLPTRDGALRAQQGPVSTMCFCRAAQNGRGGNQP